MASTELFKKIRDQIERAPETFYMGTWGTDFSLLAAEEEDYYHEYYDPNDGGWSEIPASECGTTRCVAGWAVHFEAERLGIDVDRPLWDTMLDLAIKLKVKPNYEAVAKHVLGIDDNNLFWEADDVAYEIVNEYAEGLRD